MESLERPRVSFSCFPFVNQWCTFSLKNWFHGASGLIFPHLTLVTQFPALKISWMAPGSLFSRTQHWLLSFPSIFNGNKSTHSWPRLSIGAQEEFLLNLVQTPFLEKLFFSLLVRVLHSFGVWFSCSNFCAWRSEKVWQWCERGY